MSRPQDTDHPAGLAVLHQRLAEVEARIQILEDDRAVREVLARYGYHADACMDDAFVGMFTEDCVMDVSAGVGEDPYAVLQWRGFDGMRAFLSERTAVQGDGFRGKSLHMQGNNGVVHVSGDEAVATGYSFILQQVERETRLVSASANQWRLRKINGRWLIRKRTRRRVGAGDVARLLEAVEP